MKKRFSLVFLLSLEMFIFSFPDVFSSPVTAFFRNPSSGRIDVNISGTSLSDIDESEFSNWVALSRDCSSLFWGKKEVLTFKKGDREFTFETDAVSLLYENDAFNVGQVLTYEMRTDDGKWIKQSEPAPSFDINRIAKINTPIPALGEVELIYIGRQNFVNSRRMINCSHISCSTIITGTPVITIHEGFFVLIKQKRKNLDIYGDICDYMFPRNHIIASESLDSEEIFIIGDLENFLRFPKDILLLPDSSSIFSDYITKLFGKNSSKIEQQTTPFFSNSIWGGENIFSDGIIQTPRGTIYRFEGNKIRAFPKFGSEIISSTKPVATNYSSHASILQRQKQFLNDFSSEIVEDPYRAIEEAFKHTPDIIDQHFKNNPSLDRERFETLRRTLAMESIVTDDLTPSDIKHKMYNVEDLAAKEVIFYNHDELLYPDIFKSRGLDSSITEVQRDKNGVYPRKLIIPFLIIKNLDKDDIDDIRILSPDVIHMQYLYFVYLHLAEYLEKNNLVVGGTFEATYNMETGDLEKLKLINDGIYSLMKREKLKISEKDKDYMFQSIIYWHKLRHKSGDLVIEEDIVTRD